MVKLNPRLLRFERSYLFFEIEQKLAAFRKEHPGADLLNLGVGDVALPIAPLIIQAIQKAAGEMGTKAGMRGYGPGCGYRFLREAIAKVEYDGLDISSDEVFVSDGINSDICHASDLFCKESIVAIPNPAYPLYAATAMIDGFEVLVHIRGKEENGFLPTPPKERADIVYLCSPNNPVGSAFTRKELEAWVEWAKKEEAILLYDGAYAAFIEDLNKPKSIFEIPGAKEVAIEFRSFSKAAGFTGLRCGYTVVPKELHIESIPVRTLWEMRQETKTNGVSYPVQRGAEAALLEGKEQAMAQIREYKKSGKLIRNFLTEQGYTFFGGDDSPYIFWKIPKSTPSWEFFRELLETTQIVAIPGRGFGDSGEGYMRLSTFCTETQAKEAIRRLCALK